MTQKIQVLNPKPAIDAIIKFAGRTGSHRAPIVLVVGDRPRADVQKLLLQLLEQMEIGHEIRHYAKSSDLSDYLRKERHYLDPICYWHVESPLLSYVQKELATKYASGTFRNFAPALTLIVMKESPLGNLGRETLSAPLMSCIGHRVVDISPPTPAWTRLVNLFTAVARHTAKKAKVELTVDPEAEALLCEALKTSESEDQDEIVGLAKKCTKAAEKTGTDRISYDLLFQHMPDRYRNAVVPPVLATIQ